MTGLAALFPASTVFAKYYAGHLNEKQTHEVDVLAGAFMMLSREAITQVKGFDEDYFMYGEDIDLSYRVQKAGFKNYYFAGTTIIHFKGESTQKNSYNYIRTFYAAMKLFVNKHYKAQQSTLFLMKVAIGFGRSMACLILFIKQLIPNVQKKSGSTVVAVIAGQQRFDAIIHLIRHSKIPLVIKGRIAVDPNDKGIALGKLEDIGQIIKASAVEQLVFCEGDISYKRIIETIEQQATKATCLFHSNNSSSIVGSNNKHTKGIFIAKA